MEEKEARGNLQEAAPSGRKTAIELKGVCKRFGDASAVEDLTLSIYEGEFFSLLGPSGCGKTTTLRMIAGFEEPTEGEISVAGKPMRGVPPYRRPVNTVFQSYALFPHLSVFDNIAFGLREAKVPKREIEQRVADACALVQLEGLEGRKPFRLSGGQQQRVALARALVNRPKVLLLDEPLGALDLKLRKGMQLELKNLQHEVGITFVYVTHDQEEALTMSDRIAVMNQGRVYQLADPATLYESPRNRFVADFIGQTNILSGEVEEVVGERALLRTDEGLRVEATIRARRVEPGDRAHAAVRPEKIRFSAGGDNAFLGVVRDVVYMGSSTQYMVELREKRRITVNHQNIRDGDILRVGEEVEVSWDAANCLLLEE